MLALVCFIVSAIFGTALGIALSVLAYAFALQSSNNIGDSEGKFDLYTTNINYIYSKDNVPLASRRQFMDHYSKVIRSERN